MYNTCITIVYIHYWVRNNYSHHWVVGIRSRSSLHNSICAWTPRLRAQRPQKWSSSSLSISGGSCAPATTYTQSTWPGVAGNQIRNEYYICCSLVTYVNPVSPATKFILHSCKQPGMTYAKWLTYVTLGNPSWRVDFSQFPHLEGFDMTDVMCCSVT